MHNPSKRRSKWLWLTSGVAVFSLTGCAMYPSKPGDWPSGSWAWWGHVLQFVSKIMDFFAHYMGGNYALALLALTIIVRVIILPLFLKQIKSSRAMQELQPEIQKIRSKYKGDNQKIQEETMKLWQQYGVNPMAGCFPMLIQLPVLYALFGAIEGNQGLNASGVLWIHSLARPDPYFILPILAGITTYFSSRVMMTGNDPQQKMMLYIMPVFIVLIGSRMAAGLALYWTYSNVFTAVQGFFVRSHPATAEASSGGGSGGKNSAGTKAASGKGNATNSRSKALKQPGGSAPGKTATSSKSKSTQKGSSSQKAGSTKSASSKGSSSRRPGSSQRAKPSEPGKDAKSTNRTGNSKGHSEKRVSKQEADNEG